MLYDNDRDMDLASKPAMFRGWRMEVVGDDIFSNIGIAGTDTHHVLVHKHYF